MQHTLLLVVVAAADIDTPTAAAEQLVDDEPTLSTAPMALSLMQGSLLLAES